MVWSHILDTYQYYGLQFCTLGRLYRSGRHPLTKLESHHANCTRPLSEPWKKYVVFGVDGNNQTNNKYGAEQPSVLGPYHNHGM